MSDEKNGIVLGSQEDYVFAKGKDPVGVLGNNCGDKKREVENGYTTVRFGECSHPTSIDADAYSLTVLLAQVIAAGGVFDTSSGHKTVTNTTRIGNYNTYLSYARGNDFVS